MEMKIKELSRCLSEKILYQDIKSKKLTRPKLQLQDYVTKHRKRLQDYVNEHH